MPPSIPTRGRQGPENARRSAMYRKEAKSARVDVRPAHAGWRGEERPRSEAAAPTGQSVRAKAVPTVIPAKTLQEMT